MKRHILILSLLLSLSLSGTDTTFCYGFPKETESSPHEEKPQSGKQAILIYGDIKKHPSYKLLAIDTEKNRIYEFPLEGMMHDNPYIANDPVPAFDEVAVQFLVKVQPKNGAPASYIQKTFRLNYTIQYKY